LSAEERAIYDYEQEAKSRYLSQIASAKYEVEWEYSKQIKEKDKALEEKDKALEEQSKALEEKIREIEEYKRLLNIN
ncbi:MAG: DUF3987 domain-containing protein, partial [Bacteroidales bacterium]|nr:DUF3987 domain-containing protein [Bacteroidales bacterium]